MEVFKIRSPAKVNLRLKIVERYNDGFHGLDMLNCRLELADQLTFKMCKLENSVANKIQLSKLTFSSAIEAFELDKNNNSIVAALKILNNYYPIEQEIDIELLKQIPAGGGLAGGSSNAASAINFIATHIGLLNFKENLGLMADLQRLSSDLIYLLDAISPALVKGRGEVVKPLNHKLPLCYPIFLIFPKIHCASGLMYKHFAQNFNLSDVQSCLKEDLEIRTISDLMEVVDNDFLRVVFDLFPNLEKLYLDLQGLDIGKVGLSGSGSTLFIIPKLDSNQNSAKLTEILKLLEQKLFNGQSSVTLSSLQFDMLRNDY